MYVYIYIYIYIYMKLLTGEFNIMIMELSGALPEAQESGRCSTTTECGVRNRSGIQRASERASERVSECPWGLWRRSSSCA